MSPCRPRCIGAQRAASAAPDRARGLLLATATLLVSAGGCEFEHGSLSEVPDGEDNPNSYACDCTCGGEQRLVSSAPAAGSDDAEQDLSTGSVRLDGAVLDLVEVTGVSQLVGIRFPSLDIPAGSTIVSATVQLSVGAFDTTATHLSWRGERSGNAAPFTSATSNVSGRPETAAAVTWSPAAWDSMGAAAPAQRTPDLSAIVQEVVGLAGWDAGNALVLLVRGRGRRAALSYDGSTGQAAVLSVAYNEPPVVAELQACMPSQLNPNREHPTPTDVQLSNDCRGRIADTLSGLAAACAYPSPCTCVATAGSSRFAAACDQPCAEVGLTPHCANFNPEAGVALASNIAGDEPVCTVRAALTAELFAQESRCSVWGLATVAVADQTKTPEASGVVNIDGPPCPGATCAVGMAYAIDVEDITFSNLWGSATFAELAALGGSLPSGAALLSETGFATFAPDSTVSSGRGKRDGEGQAVIAPNSDKLQVGVLWEDAVCSLQGALVGSTDTEVRRCENAGPSANALCTTDEQCTDDPGCAEGLCACLPVAATTMTLSLSVDGDLINQPPTANAGADLSVECNQTNAARFLLDSSASFDPDGNIASVRWFLGDRMGPMIDPLAHQTVGSSESYVLRVVDALAQADEDRTMVRVVDASAPTVSCNAVPTIRAAEMPRRFTASAIDVCDADTQPTISRFNCFRLNAHGKLIDSTASCRVTTQGSQITIEDTGGVTERITWTAQAVDDAGNVGVETCEVAVVQP